MSRLLVIIAASTSWTANASDAPSAFRIETPRVVLEGVPVSKVVVTAVDADGALKESFDGTARIGGLRLSRDGETLELPAFENGRLVLETDVAMRTRVDVEDEIVVEHGEVESRARVRTVPGWLSLLPPVVAIALAIWLRQVLVALFVGVLAGTLVLAAGHPLEAVQLALSDFVLQAIVDPDGGAYSHMHVILFTTFLGSMVAVMFASGGTGALVDSMRPLLKTRERTQLGTALLGLIVFFDDYANTLLVGTTMRPVTDHQRISRAKLAFLVDATAAPVAGLAIVSTWVGFEIGLIAEAYADLGLSSEVYGTFIATLPYRFYPILLLVFVFANASTGRDFGPMLRAERRARAGNDGTRAASAEAAGDAEESRPRKIVNALLPLGVLLVAIIGGLTWTGLAALASSNAELVGRGEPTEPTTIGNVLSNANSYVVLLYSSFVASLVAIGTAVVTGSATLNEATNAWVEGVKQMLPAVLVLVLAWALAAVCAPEHLNTASFLVESATGRVSTAWMPTLAFLLAAGVSFATGTSWATMGLLIPLFIPFTHDLLLSGAESVDPNDPLLLGTIGAVLAGAIFGDHCSPISDTTVLSSAAAGCDHLEHVGTQLPYAITVGGLSLLVGSVPLAFGVPPWLGLVVGAAAVVGLVRFAGSRIDEGADE